MLPWDSLCNYILSLYIDNIIIMQCPFQPSCVMIWNKFLFLCLSIYRYYILIELSTGYDCPNVWLSFKYIYSYGSYYLILDYLTILMLYWCSIFNVRCLNSKFIKIIFQIKCSLHVQVGLMFPFLRSNIVRNVPNFDCSTTNLLLLPSFR